MPVMTAARISGPRHSRQSARICVLNLLPESLDFVVVAVIDNNVALFEGPTFPVVPVWLMRFVRCPSLFDEPLCFFRIVMGLRTHVVIHPSTFILAIAGRERFKVASTCEISIEPRSAIVPASAEFRSASAKQSFSP